jgi:hypothetical protein
MDNNLQFKISLIDSAGKVVKSLTGRLENLNDTVGRVQHSINQTSSSIDKWGKHFVVVNQFTQLAGQLSSALNDLAAPATDNSDVPNIEPPRGLEGNPAETGEVFTDNVGYVKNAKKLQLGTELTTKYPSLQQLVDMDGKTYRADYYSDNGGLLMTSRARVDEGNKNKQEKEKFDKEHAMCLKLAKVNHIVDYRASVEGEFDIFLDGKKADLKQTNSHNNIVKYGKKAIRKQGADLVVFEFGEINAHILNELAALQRIGIHGYYMVGEILVPF